MGHIVLDLTSLAYQPTTKSRERSGHPWRHVTFARSERKPAYPAHTQDMHDDEDDGPLAQLDHMVVSGDGDDQPLVQPASRKEPVKESVNLPYSAEFLRKYEEEKDLQSGETHLPHRKTCQETRVSDQKRSRFWEEIQKVNLSVTSSTSCLTCAT